MTPTITVGTPIKVFRVTMMDLLPTNSSVASNAPRGRPIRVPISRAAKLTCRDMSTIPKTPASRWESRPKAASNAFDMRSILSRQWQNGCNETDYPIFDIWLKWFASVMRFSTWTCASIWMLIQ